MLAAPLLLFAVPVLVLLEPRTASPLLPFGVLLALLGACAAYAIVRRDGPVHFVAAFFAVVAEAVWSAKYLAPERLLPALPPALGPELVHPAGARRHEVHRRARNLDQHADQAGEHRRPSQPRGAPAGRQGHEQAAGGLACPRNSLGHDPVSAPPGYRLYYLWAMAGGERRLALHEDPAHRWIHDA